MSARHRWSRSLFAGMAAWAALGAPCARAQAVPVNASLERSVKAAFLYKFLSYAEFPAGAFDDPTAPVTIGVLGTDDIAAELAWIVAGRTVGQRPVTVRTLRENEAVDGVHLLFVPGWDQRRVLGLLKAAGPARLLAVTECENCLQHGSVINFKIVGRRVRFDVSLEAAERHNIKLSSRLLTVASLVHRAGP
ncbi:YfiR family protein [Massilia glaciei]|nr:YfiR family protein [Massilia glaciei]